MAYATISDVQALQPNRPIGASTTPSVTQVTRYLELTTGDIDALIAARGYQLPIPTAATGALTVLAYGNALAARARVELGAPVSAASGARAEWEAWRQDLVDGTLDLPGAPAAPARARGGLMSAASPIFTRDMQF